MTDNYEPIKRTLIDLSRKYSRPNKPLSLQDLTTIVSAISTFYGQESEQVPVKLMSAMNEVLDGLLNNLLVLADPVENNKNANDRLDLFKELLGIILDHYEGKEDGGLFFCLTEFLLKQLRPCIPTLKQKEISELLNKISCSKKMLPLPKSKIARKHFIITLLFQLLYENQYKKLDEIIHQYIKSNDEMKVGEFESFLLSWLGIYVMKGCYMGYRIMGDIVEEYMKSFTAGYVKDGKFIGTRFDPKILLILIREIHAMVMDVNLVKHLGSQETKIKCNICNVSAIKFFTYNLEVCDRRYTVNVCSPCHLNFEKSNNLISNILIHLALSCEPVSNEIDLKGIREITGVCEGVCCEINSELKGEKDKLLKCGMSMRNIGKCLPNLWSALIILANHNDTATRCKSLKTIIEAYPSMESDSETSKNLNEKINKCIGNRLSDTDSKVRHTALLGMIMIKDLETLFEVVDYRYLEDIGGTTAMIGEIVEKLVAKVTKKKGGIKEDQIIRFVEMLARLGLIYVTRNKLSKTKNTRSSNLIPSPVSILTPHISQLQLLLKPHENEHNLQKHLCSSILFPQKQIHNEVYVTMVEMLREISRDRLGTWLHESEVLEMFIGKIIEGNIFEGRSCCWLLGIIISNREFLIVRRLMERIVELSSNCDFKREEKAYNVCITLCKLQHEIFNTDLLEMREWLSGRTKELENLRESVIKNILPSTDKKGEGSDDIFVVCNLIGTLDKILGEIHKTIEIYFSYCELVEKALRNICEENEKHDDHNDESRRIPFHNSITLNENFDKNYENKMAKVETSIWTIKKLLCLLPNITINMRELSLDLSFNPNTNMIHYSIITIIRYLLEQQEETNQQSGSRSFSRDACKSEQLIWECGKLLVKLWGFIHEYLVEDENIVFEFLSKSNSKLSNTLLMGIYSAIKSETAIRQLEKYRDLFMSILNEINHVPSFRSILRSLALYLIIRQLINKGLITYLHVSKIIICGLCVNGNSVTDVGNVCGEIVKEVSGDLTESKQFFANFGEALKFILFIEQPPATHMLYLLTSSYIPSTFSTLILSKHEQSLESLKPTIHKIFCEFLNKFVTSGRIMIPSDENTSELFLVMNSILKSTVMHLDEFKALMNCLIAVVDFIYLEVMSKDRLTGAEIHLWAILRGLVYLGQGYPVREACRNAEKFFSVKNELIEIQNLKKIDLQNVPGVEIYEQIESLYDATLYGFSSVQDKENDEYSTFEISNDKNRMLSKGLNHPKERLATKPKINTMKDKDNLKKTKKAIQSKSAPKIQEDWEESIEETSIENERYKRKLRNKTKMVI